VRTANRDLSAVRLAPISGELPATHQELDAIAIAVAVEEDHALLADDASSGDPVRFGADLCIILGALSAASQAQANLHQLASGSTDGMFRLVAQNVLSALTAGTDIFVRAFGNCSQQVKPVELLLAVFKLLFCRHR
jgi:hypothetical protein